MDSKRVIENIIEVRKLKKFSRKQLSLAIGRSHNYISLIEHGYTDLKIAEFIKICEVLEVTPNHLIYGTKDHYSCAKQLENLPERDFLLIKHLITLMETPTEYL